MRYVYAARLKPVGQTVLVSFRDLPEAVTEGKDREDALHWAARCLADALGYRMLHDEGVPIATSPKRGEVLVQVALED
jgi:antitoxin HicB